MRWLLPLAFFSLSATYALMASGELSKPYVYSSMDGTSWIDGSRSDAFDDTVGVLSPYGRPARDAMSILRYKAFGETRPGVVAGQDNWLFNSADFATPEDASKDLQLILAKVSRVHAEASQRGIQLVFIPLPAKADVMRDKHGYDVSADRAEGLYREVVRGAEELGVMTVDARKAMLEAKELHDDVIFRTDQHWTASGSAAVAAAVAEKLQIEPSHTFELVREEVHPFQGDLSTFIGGEGVVERAGVTLENFQDLRADATAILNADADAEIALVGTSASYDSRWAFAEHLQQQLGRMVTNYSVFGYGPIYPMYRFGGQLSSFKTPPEVVLWEFPVNSVYIPGYFDYDL